MDQVYIAGIYDQQSYDWGTDIFNYTVKLINEGWWDMPDRNATVVYQLGDEKCDENAAVRAYWKLRTENGGIPPDGIVGARCSGPSASLARISGLEGVPMVSPASNSAELSNKDAFPYFSRLVAPNNQQGETGALVAMLRSFQWDRVTLLYTDNPFSIDGAKEFRKIWSGDHTDESGTWTGRIRHSDTIRIADDLSVDESSVRQTLAGVPVDDPSINSRVIVLLAHNQHAFPILKMATLMNFQPDTIWIGPSSWVGRPAINDDLSWLPKYPGYLGLSPYRNRNAEYQAYFSGLQAWQQATGREVWTELPVFAAEMVDAIVLLVMAIESMPLGVQRRNGTAISSQLRSMSFAGVSGPVEFTPTGDRKDPRFSILNSNLSHGWTEVGNAKTSIGMTSVVIPKICWAVLGCDRSEIPSDQYPVPRTKLPSWAVAMIVIFIVLLLVVAFKYWRSKKSKRRIVQELETFRTSVVGMRAAETDYIPTLCSSSATKQRVETAAHPSDGMLAVHPVDKIQWCWQETPTMMGQHDAANIVGDRADCWIKYAEDIHDDIEAAFQEQGRKGVYSPMTGYVIDFGTMVQTKQVTGFQRKVQRLVQPQTGIDSSIREIAISDIQTGKDLPSEISEEPQMVMVKGDIVQISKQRPDGWAFGTKLFHADEEKARELVRFAITSSGGDADKDDTRVLPDTGWFPMDLTRQPSAEDLKALQSNVGDTAGALEAPSHWDPVADPSVVQQHILDERSQEYQEVVRGFKLTQPQARILSVDRIQNLAMWQSYVVKRQTICRRQTGHKLEATASRLEKAEIERKALERFERRWLWHGSNSEVMDKILQQGFNRSFCGKNATMYGKGVYFARDASYSSATTYAVPDKKGNQYIMACRVVVGEYCRGVQDAVTPDIRDFNTQALFDTTVGHYSDDMANPSIYVTYHDAQAYPEYLIKFRA